MDRWEPASCPLARGQGFGYKHYHSEKCRTASPAQIAADQAELEELRRRSLRYRLLRLIRVIRD
jgi:hypothetical protein